jgi:hypothetical protein
LAFNNADRLLLAAIDEHQHTIMGVLNIMAKGMDALVAAVDNNAKATDSLSDEVQEAIDYIKNHSDNDPALFALAARLEEKNAKANSAKDDLDKATAAVDASGGPAT